MPEILPPQFFERDAGTVAKSLLKKVLIRKINGETLGGEIIETEAYYGENDPASRAYKGRKTKLNKWMWDEAGTIFIYMVHGHWLLNVVTGEKNVPSAVLIRAIKPLFGVNHMLRNRNVNRLEELTSGPGKLTRALAITAALNGFKVTDPSSPLIIVESDVKEKFEIGLSHRIGVKEDLPQPLRFYVKKERFLSRKH